MASSIVQWSLLLRNFTCIGKWRGEALAACPTLQLPLVESKLHVPCWACRRNSKLEEMEMFDWR